MRNRIRSFARFLVTVAYEEEILEEKRILEQSLKRLTEGYRKASFSFIGRCFVQRLSRASDQDSIQIREKMLTRSVSPTAASP